MLEFNVRVEIDKFYVDCWNCYIKENCANNYGECRYYNKSLWKQIDKAINKARKEFYETNVYEREG